MFLSAASVVARRIVRALTIWLERVRRRCGSHYSQQSPHRALALAVPATEASARASPASTREVRRRDLFGGLIHEYDAVA